MSHAPFEQPFAHRIYKQKYAWEGEEWADTAKRVVHHVLGAVNINGHRQEALEKLVRERKFIPGGRYLYASGRGLHQTQNCLLLRAEDTREGWADLTHKSTMALMTGAGIGVDYSDVRGSGSIISRTGGVASGPLSLMKMINEVGRNVMQGGARRSAIWAGLRWSHPDVFDFIKAKDWSDEIKAMKEKDFTFPADLDMTNISVILDKDFFDAYEDAQNPQHFWAVSVFEKTLNAMVTTAEPGFSVDYDNPRESLRNAPVCGDTHVLTNEGYRQVAEIVGIPSTVWTGRRWAEDVTFTKTFEDVPVVKVEMTNGHAIRCEPGHEFLVEKHLGEGESRRLVDLPRVKARDLQPGDTLHVSPPVDDDADSSEQETRVLVLSVTSDGQEDVFCADVKVPEHSFMAEGVIVSNCTEVTSEDDSDVCNLGSLNMAAFDNKEEFRQAVRLGTLFLLAGTVYSDLPYEEVYETREKNRRLGLGVMGLHEWLLKRNKKYGPDEELGEWLAIYRDESRKAADEWSGILRLSRPVKVRAIAPTGTIGIIAETTTGIEPIYAAAFKRRVRDAHHSGDRVNFEYVVDPTAKRLIDQGTDPGVIEDCYTLSYDVERRIAFQAWVQEYVDHGISSTINLPAPIVDPLDQQEFGETLMKYLPKLRGVTCYPDGSRGGQPLTPVDVEYALQHTGVVFEESLDKCVGGQCGT